MKNKIGYFLFTLGLILLLIGFCYSKCQAQQYSFNYRAEQKGSYIFDIDGHSLFIHERFVYEENNEHKLWQNDWDEEITSQEYYQDRIEIQTNSALWIFFYCEDDTKSSQICELQYHPTVGETLTYLKKLNQP